MATPLERLLRQAIRTIGDAWPKRRHRATFPNSHPEIPIQDLHPLHPEFIAFRTDMPLSIDTSPIDQLSYVLFDQQIKALFVLCATDEERRRQQRSADAAARVPHAEAKLAAAALKHEQVAEDLVEAQEQLEQVKAELTNKVPTSRSSLPGLIRYLATESKIKKIATFIGIGYGLFIDIVNFKGVLELLNKTFSGLENTVLASGFSIMAGICAIGLGRSLAHRKNRDGVAGWSQIIVYLLILISMCITSFLVRVMHTSVVSDNPFGQAKVKTVVIFGGVTGWLTAIFFTTILIATTWATVDEIRLSTNLVNTALRRMGKKIKKTRKRVRRAEEGRKEALGARNNLLAQQDFALAARDSAITSLKARTDRLFADARLLVAQRVGDPAVTDTVAHAPVITLPDDLPTMYPSFGGLTLVPPSSAAAA